MFIEAVRFGRSFRAPLHGGIPIEEVGRRRLSPALGRPPIEEAGIHAPQPENAPSVARPARPPRERQARRELACFTYFLINT
jgi:hypothetical protein